MRYNDPTGHCVATLVDAAAAAGTGGLAALLGGAAVAIDAVCWTAVTEGVILAANAVATWGPQAPALVDANLANAADQAGHNAGQQQAGESGTGDPGGFDPNDPWNSFRKAGLQNKDINELQKASKNPKVSLDLVKAYQQFDFFRQQNIQISGHALVEAQKDRISVQRIADTFTGAARNTQYFWNNGRVAQWSPNTNVAVIIEQATREVVTVFERTTPQRDWQSMTAFEVLKWLDK